MGAAPFVCPSGEQYVLQAGGTEAVITEVGAALRSLSYDRRPVLWEFSESEVCSAGRGQVLAPWPNRLDGGRYTFRGASAEASVDHRHGAAMHGLVRWLYWDLIEQRRDHVRLSCRLAPQPGYPFSIVLDIGYTLYDGGLGVEAVARNSGANDAPFGLGFHPYLYPGRGGVDAAAIRIPAHRHVSPAGPRATNPDDIFSGSPAGLRVGSALQLADLRDVVFAHCLGAFDCEPDGIWRVVLTQSGSAGLTITLWAESVFRYAVLYTADNLEPGLARRAIAVEPMTCPPNALVTGVDLIVLKPGASVVARWGFDVASDSAPGV